MPRIAPKLVLSIALFAAWTAPPAIAAQERGEPGAVAVSPVFFGGGLTGARPDGEFRDYVAGGFGGGGHAIVRLPSSVPIAIRLDGGFLNYGRETKRTALSPTIGDRIQVDVTTTNNIALLGIGPQIGVPDGKLRPYLGGIAGIGYFFTQSQVNATRGQEPFAETTNYDDLTFSYAGLAGVYVPLSTRRAPVSLDVGLRYVVNGRTRYLREGSIVDGPGGSISFSPIESETNFFALQIGVSVGSYFARQGS
jgi:hypothetical protein